MSSLEVMVLAGIVAGFVAFAVMLAWADFQTRRG